MAWSHSRRRSLFAGLLFFAAVAYRCLAAGGQILLVLAHAGTDAPFAGLHACTQSLDVGLAGSAGRRRLFGLGGGSGLGGSHG